MAGSKPTGNQAHEIELVRRSAVEWHIEPVGDMRVPGVVYASESLLPGVVGDRSLQQVANVATLPGIVAASYAMPDVHWGYGFPIGGVAATDVDHDGVVSPGGVGFDISCGVRLLLSPLEGEDVEPRLDALMDELGRSIPAGMGKGAVWNVSDAELDSILRHGASFAVERGHGSDRDLERCEDRGSVADADAAEVSQRAKERGLQQVGSLGSGNHFLEVQVVDSLFDSDVADAFGLHLGQVCVMIHCGSRGLGHQICSDHVKEMLDAMPAAGISVPDKQLACARVRSPEGRRYLGAMAAAANYGRANRQLLSEATRRSFAGIVGTGQLDLLYDVSHNLAKLEEHEVEGRKKLLCVHRKGATRALPPGHAELPAELAPVGQPVLLPGSMGTASYVLAGAENGHAFHSTAHGAGRVMSRHAARKQVGGKALARQLEGAGIRVRASSWKGLAEEAPFSYKDVDEVVAICEQAGLARRVVRLRPVGVVKG
ncbi:MAG: RNA-splicing ligase RtcB [Acidimicrobiales bacterium]|nr:MAG: RtcB family protein [Actinomycetota bacterium]MBV6510221.1 RNA-splicing ligase RtcB [Acidimicrobiales bacterium]RIK04189.1 MAG: RNA-splicing ligase RtcB [Acidobacteriota bacterium]